MQIAREGKGDSHAMCCRATSISALSQGYFVSRFTLAYILYCRLFEEFREKVYPRLYQSARRSHPGLGRSAKLTAEMAFVMVLAAAAPRDDFARSTKGSSLAAWSVVVVILPEVLLVMRDYESSETPHLTADRTLDG